MRRRVRGAALKGNAMLGAPLCRSIFWFTLGLITIASVEQPVRLYRAKQGTDRLPAGTSLVGFNVRHESVYYAREPGWQSMTFSLNGASALLQSGHDCFVVQPASQRVVRHLVNSQGWWEANSLSYLDLSNSRIVTRGQTMPASVGAAAFIAVNPTGRFFLAKRLVRPGERSDSGTPSYELQLWERKGRNKPQYKRQLAVASFDPASEGNPRRLEVLDGHLAVFGFPGGGAFDQDFIGVLQGDRVTAPLKDSKGRLLRFAVESPVLAANAIVGIAEVVAPPYVLTGERFLYRITTGSVEMHPIAPSVRFVTYNPRKRAVGIAVSQERGVSIRYAPLREFAVPVRRGARSL